MPTTFAPVPTLADYLVSGYWEDNGLPAHHWATSSISVNIADLNAAEQYLALAAFNAWHEVCGLDFTFTTGGATIYVINDGTGHAEADAIWTGSGQINSALIHVSSDWNVGAGGGIYSYFYQTYLHEIGHALGLGHQGPYNGNATYDFDADYTNDTWQWSVMSYFPQEGEPRKLVRFRHHSADGRHLRGSDTLW